MPGIREAGAELITRDMLRIAKEFGFIEPTDLDMDTTVQESGITHPTLGPELMDQIDYWLRCGKVAPGKIIALWKLIPKAIPKGKIGKPVEFGRKWIVNAYRGGYVLVFAPENPKIAN